MFMLAYYLKMLGPNVTIIKSIFNTCILNIILYNTTIKKKQKQKYIYIYTECF